MKSRSEMMKEKLKLLKRTNTVHIGGVIRQYNASLSRSESIDNSLNLSGHEESFRDVIDTPLQKTSQTQNRYSDLLNNLDIERTNQEADANYVDDNVLRRGRRQAIIDNKNMIGEADLDDNSNDNPESVTNSALDLCKQTVTSVNILKVKQNRTLYKQNTIADLTARAYQSNAQNSCDDSKKRSAKAFFKLRTKSKEGLVDLCSCLNKLTKSEFHDTLLASFRDKHWTDLEGHRQKQVLTDAELRRREAVWELFKSELVFLLDHLMVLKHCFMEPLKRLQVDGLLMFVEPDDLFGNLDDIAYVSYSFCKELISSLTRDMIANEEFGKTAVLVKPMINWSLNSRNGEVYHKYCINYDCALTTLDVLRKYVEFSQFEKYCALDSRCRRLQLTDLLIAPMQHYTRLPLLLVTIRKYTQNQSEFNALTDIIESVENSLRTLEDKMRWMKNYDRLQEIQNQLIWPSIQEIDNRIFIPEFLKNSLAQQPCENMIANPKRQLLFEGNLQMNENGKMVDIYSFLFDDLFLLTKMKKFPKKKSITENVSSIRSPTEGGVFIVIRQPIAMDRFAIHDIGSNEANANGLKNAFVLVVISRFQQIINVVTFQASSESNKTQWVESLRNGQQIFQEKLRIKLDNRDSSLETNKHSKLVNSKRSSQKNSNESLSAIPYSPQMNIKRAQSVRHKTTVDDEDFELKQLSERPLQYENNIFFIESSFSPPLSPNLHNFIGS